MIPDEPWLGHAATSLAVLALAAGSGAGEGVLARIAGPLGDDARRGLGYLRALPADARRAAVVRWRARVRTPVPDGIRAVHPTAIEAALAALPDEDRDDARRALGGAASEPRAVGLARAITAAWPRLPAIAAAASPPADVTALLALPAGELVAALRRAGGVHVEAARRIAAGGAPPPELGSARAILARIAGDGLDRPACLERIGLRAFAPYLMMTADGLRGLLVRLPAALAAELAPAAIRLADPDDDALTSPRGAARWAALVRVTVGA